MELRKSSVGSPNFCNETSKLWKKFATKNCSLYLWVCAKMMKTRNLGQSPTRVHPAP